MNILVIGNGGREHALAWKIGQSARVKRVFVAPGNAGTASDAENVPIAATDVPGLLKFAKQNKIDLAVIGPEAALGAGVVDALQGEGIRAFGPSKAASDLETSKVFCKNLLRHADVPTADYRVFRDARTAITYLREREDTPVVVKADGLAAGKGVVVCDNREQALAAVERIGVQKEFGDAGNQIVIEERLHGQEASVLAITDGHTLLTMPACQDHKRAHDGDTGPNTGGMGAYCPTPLVTDQLLHKVEEKILVPTVHQMKRSRRPFRGILYAGLMITSQGVKVLEYNVRFGDPECQPLLMRLKSDLVDLLEATVDSRLDEVPPPEWDPRPAVCVVMASEGYPGKYERGQPIRGLDDAAKLPDVKVFHAGTALKDGQVVTDGGRVLGVTALGATISGAKLQAYTAVKNIRFSGAWCRKDISDKALSYK
jgi:phosphoribosylamine---glycine ligase